MITSIIYISAIIIIFIILYKHYKLSINEQFTTNTWTKDTEIIIISSHWNEDLSWLININIPVIVCGKDGEETSAISSNIQCKTPNEGYEASSYLKFIYENYDNLPQYVAFIHGHETAWHQERNIKNEIINGNWKGKPYYTLNNRLIDERKPGTNHWTWLEQLWEPYFKPYLNIDMPTEICHDCCAQFIVSRDRILANSREAYNTWYNLLINKNNELGISTRDIAICFEWIWHIIFREPPVVREFFVNSSNYNVVGIPANQ